MLLTHASGHSAIANARAMALAGVDAGTTDPPGGEIVRDADGAPIGVFRETAQGIVRAALARERDAWSRERRVSELEDTNVPKARARELYEDLTPAPTPEEIELRRMQRLAGPPRRTRGAGAPKKKERRQLRRLKEEA